MNKQQRNIETLLAALKEEREIEKVILSLPRGYISVKQISGHTYYYRQWREGTRVVSFYQPEATLAITESKIAVRKQNEQLLKVIRKSVKSASKSILKAELLTEEQIAELKAGVAKDEVEVASRKVNLGKLNEAATKAKETYLAGKGEYNRILLAKWGL